MDKSQINLLEILKNRDKVKEFYKDQYTRQRLRNKFYELWNEKYGKKTKNKHARSKKR